MYGRTVPVLLKYPNTNKSIKGLALLDDQSDVTLVDPAVVSALAIQPSHLNKANFTIRTVQGISQDEVFILEGLQVSSINSTFEVELPFAYIHKPLEDSSKQIPEPEVISSIPGVAHLAQHFHKKEDLPTLILIGRDCPLAHLQEQMTPSNDQLTVASKTPFGWVLIGSPHSHRHFKRLASSLQTEAATDSDSSQTSKEDERLAYSRDEVSFLQLAVKNFRIRPDQLIEFPLPFKSDKPTFSFNRGIALSRTKNALNSLRKKNPEMFQSSIDKFAKNINVATPRFLQVPKDKRQFGEGHAYYIPLIASGIRSDPGNIPHVSRHR